MSDDSHAFAPETVMKQVMALQPMLIAYAYAIVGDWHEAEDVFQDAFLEIHRIHGRYDAGKGSLEMWARGIVRMLCKNRLKKRAVNLNRRKLFLEEVEREFDQADADETGDELARQISAMRRCMAKLPPDAFRLLHDFYVKGKKGRELSERESLNPNQLRSLLHRWKGTLRECIARQLGNGAETRTYDFEFYPGEAEFGAALHVSPAGKKLPYFLGEAAFAYVATRFRPIAQNPEVEFIDLLRHVSESRIVMQRRRALRISAIAAALAVCSGGVFTFIRVKEHIGTPGKLAPVELVIGKTRGEIHCIRAGQVLMLNTGDRLLPGDVMSIQPEGAAYLRYMPEGTGVRLYQGARVKFPHGRAFNAGKDLILESGIMYADVRPQSVRPMVVETGGVRSVVKGTQFSLDAGTGGATRLEVYEGAVDLKKDAQSLTVSAGESGTHTAAGLVKSKLPPDELENGLAAHWKFDGGADTMLVDEVSGYRLNGHRLENVPRDGSVTFDGTSYAEARDPGDFHFGGAMTISLWVSPAERNDIRGLLGKYDDEGIVSEKSRRSYLLKVDDFDRIIFRISGDGMESAAMTMGTVNSLRKNEWTHVCAIYRPGESMEIYLDGELENILRRGVIPAIARTDSYLRLGNTVIKEDPAFYFRGKMDELRLYGRGLSVGEVRKLAASRGGR